MIPHSVLMKSSNPFPLEKCALLSVLHQLSTLCSDSNYEENKRGLKHFLKFQLPPDVRQQLLDIAFEDGRIYTQVDLNLYELLLSPVVDSLRIKTVRHFYRESFTRILQQLGVGLQTLILEDSSWFQSKNELAVALSHLPHLRFVSLRYLATDTMLNVLAKSCNYLEELDVTGSQGVTNEGIQRLCSPINEDICTANKTQVVKKPNRKISVPANFGLTTSRSDKTSSSSVVRIPKFIKSIRRHSVINHDNLDKAASAETCITQPQIETAAGSGAPTSVCLKTLRRITLSGTRVTREGIAVLRQHAKDLAILTSN